MRLVDDRLERRVVHQYGFGRVLDPNLEAGNVMLSQLAGDDLAVADEDHFDPEIPSCQNSTFNCSFRGEISAHRIECDFHYVLPGGPTPRPARARARDRIRNGGKSDGALPVRRSSDMNRD